MPRTFYELDWGQIYWDVGFMSTKLVGSLVGDEKGKQMGVGVYSYTGMV